jgi:hypothetical protein
VGERFDAVLLGWGSLAHLPEDDDVERTLRALRLLWPRAPLAASFFVPGPPRAEGNGLEAKLRRGVRRVLGRHGAGRDEQVLYYTGGGFLRLFTPERMTALAAAAGYDLTAVELDDQPCALFVPRENALLAAGSAR